MHTLVRNSLDEYEAPLKVPQASRLAEGFPSDQVWTAELLILVDLVSGMENHDIVKILLHCLKMENAGKTESKSCMSAPWFSVCGLLAWMLFSLLPEAEGILQTVMHNSWGEVSAGLYPHSATCESGSELAYLMHSSSLLCRFRDKNIW